MMKIKHTTHGPVSLEDARLSVSKNDTRHVVRQTLHCGEKESGCSNACRNERVGKLRHRMLIGITPRALS